MKMVDRNVEVKLGFSDGTKIVRIEDLADVTDFLEQHEEYVKVVRCKDCKKYSAKWGTCPEVDSPLINYLKPDDFCSRAERSENG